MTLVNARAAFEKAVTDAVAAADATVLMVYDNVQVYDPRKRSKIRFDVGVNFGQSTIQNQGAAQDYYIRHDSVQRLCAKNQLARLCFQRLAKLLLTGLTSVNAPGYTDTFSSSPRVLDIFWPDVRWILKIAHILLV